MKVKSLKGLKKQVDTPKGQKLNDKQLSQVCGGGGNLEHKVLSESDNWF